jgi:hypothetical protein
VNTDERTSALKEDSGNERGSVRENSRGTRAVG